MKQARIQRLTALFCTLFLALGSLPTARALPEPATDTYALITGIVGAPDVLYAVAPGGNVALNADDFRAFFYANCQNDTFRYVTFQPDASLKVSNGVLYYDYQGEYEMALTRNALSQFRFYDRSELYGTYPIKALSFAANRQAESGAVTLKFTAAGDSETCQGELRIAIQSASVIASPDTSAVVDLTWHVTAGEVLRFDRNDFRDFFKDRASSDDSFRYLTFQADSSFNPDNGYLYYDFEGKSQKRFTADTLGDAHFFYSSSRYGSYPISGLTFLAANEGGGNLVRFPFTTFGRTESYSGALVIQIDWAKVSDTTPVYGPAAPAANNTTPADTTTENKTPADTTAENKTPADTATESATPASTDNGDTTPADTAANNTTPADTAANRETSENASGSADASASNQDPDILYLVRAGESVEFSRYDFSVPAETKLKGTFRYVTFEAKSTLSEEFGLICADVGGLEEVTFINSTIDDYRFYAESDRYGNYALDSLSFRVPVTAPAHTVLVECTLHSSTGDSAVIIMSIQVQAADPAQNIPGELLDTDTGAAPTESGETTPAPTESGETTKANPTDNGDTTAPAPTDNGETTKANPNDNGETTKANPDDNGETTTSASTSNGGTTPAPTDNGETTSAPTDSDTTTNAPDDGGETTNAPDDGGDTTAPAPTDSGENEEPADTPTDTAEPGTPVEPGKPEPLNITQPFTGTPVPAGNILYATTWNTPLRLVSDDFDRLFRKVFPGGTFSHVALVTLPQNGKMFYDYYASSPFGDVDKLELLTENLSYMNFYFSPAYNDRYSLAELTYVPAGEKNICERLSFAATGMDTAGNIVQCTGDVLISVTKALITDVYGAIPKGRTVTFPASNLESNVKEGTGKSMNGFRLLKLPNASIGSIIVGEKGPSANTEQIYHWTNIEPKISALRFVPNENYTGSVDIPYLVVNSDGDGVGIGHFTLGMISTLKRFKDVTADVWCYKYVTELAAVGVIGGYGDDTYRPGVSVTWGAALKLIMLAAGYDEQPGNSMTPFQGYLDKALEDHLLPREIDLWEPVTRLEVAELAAAAMKLDTAHLSSVQPFSDTDNAAVQALNAAGIINGYYNEGESTFRPGGTLNRGQVSAIVWRMRNYQA